MSYHWSRVVARVSFVNCDPIFHGIEKNWEILPAPPSWCTGHLLDKDCIVAPIPTADYAKNMERLQLIRGIGIVSDGAVGSVLLFSNTTLEKVQSIALPSDSSTSKLLLRYILENQGMVKEYIEMGPDLDEMLQVADAALLIGDRAMDEAKRNPNKVIIDLGEAWKEITGLPMVFGVFATHRDAPTEIVAELTKDLRGNLESFLESSERRVEVISKTALRSGFSEEFIQLYFNQVSNKMDSIAEEGLVSFLTSVCQVSESPHWAPE